MSRSRLRGCGRNYGCLLARPVLDNGFGESTNLDRVSGWILATLRQIDYYTSARLQISQLGLLIAPGQFCFAVQFHVHVAFGSLYRKHVVRNLNDGSPNMLKSAMCKCRD